MDHVVHINNGCTKARPLVLRLLPGEETIFNLKIVNHGEPSNISLEANSPVFKAVRLRTPDHYVVKEETIPIMARMPDNGKRLDGEILLTGGGRESRVPITLLRDSEDPGDCLKAPGQVMDEECRDDFVGEDLVREDADNDGYDEEDAGDGNDRGVDGGIDSDVDSSIDDNDDTDDEDSESPVRRRRSADDEEDENGNDEKEPRRISFSRDRDLQSYRSARLKRAGKATDGQDSRRLSAPSRDADRFDRGKSAQFDTGEDGVEWRGADDDANDRNNGDDNRIIPRYSTRIDDSFVDKNRGHDDDYPGYRQEADSESREIIHQAEKEEVVPEDTGPRAYGAGEEYYEQEDESSSSSSTFVDKLDGFSGPASLKIVPAAIFLALVAVLVLTFIVESIPEFAGALGSSILIVTLIIYGAATLLKA